MGLLVTPEVGGAVESAGAVGLSDAGADIAAVVVVTGAAVVVEAAAVVVTAAELELATGLLVADGLDAELVDVLGLAAELEDTGLLVAAVLDAGLVDVLEDTGLSVAAGLVTALKAAEVVVTSVGLSVLSTGLWVGPIAVVVATVEVVEGAVDALVVVTVVVVGAAEVVGATGVVGPASSAWAMMPWNVTSTAPASTRTSASRWD